MGKRRRLVALACAIVIFPATWSRAEPPPIAVYAADPAFSNVEISPAGLRIALVANADAGRRLLIVDAQQKPSFNTNIGKAEVQRLAWAGEDRLVMIHANVAELGVGFNVQRAILRGALIVADDGSSAPWEVFARDAKVTGGIHKYYGFVRRNEQEYGYFSGATLTPNPGGASFDDSRPELFEVNLTDRSERRIALKPDGDALREWIMAPHGGIAATLDRNPRTGDWRLNNGAGKQIAAGRNGLASVGLETLGPSGDTVILGETREDGSRQLIEVPLAGGASRPYPTTGIVSDMIVDSGQRLLGCVDDDSVGTMHFFSAHDQAVGRAVVKAFPGKQLHWVSASDDLNRVIVRTDGPRDAGTWWFVDVKTGKAEDLGTAYAVPPEAIAPTSMFEYQASDGLRLDGAPTLPSGANKMLPAVVLPGMAERNTARFTAWSQLLASRGYAVFQPNPRGSAGKGDAFHAAGFGQRGRAIQSDISDGVAALATAGIVDPRRVCILGIRDGGYAALAGVTLQHGLYRCAVAIGADGDVQREYQRLAAAVGNQTGIARLQKIMGDPRELAKVSPVAHAVDADAPILLMHAKNDTAVDYEQSLAMQRALQRAGKSVQLITLPSGGALLADAESRLLAMEGALQFIARHNPVAAASR